MRRIVLGAAPLQLLLECGARWVGCRWLCPALACIMMAGAVRADEPVKTDSPGVTPPSGVIIRLQLAPSTPQQASQQAPPQAPPQAPQTVPEAGLEAVLEQSGAVGPEVEAGKTPAQSVRFRRPAAGAPQRGQATPRTQATPRSQAAQAPTPRPTAASNSVSSPATTPLKTALQPLIQSSRNQPPATPAVPPSEPAPPAGEPIPQVVEPAPVEASRGQGGAAEKATPMQLELNPPLELSGPAIASPDPMPSRELTGETQASPLELSLEAPQALPSSNEAVTSSEEVGKESRVQTSDLSNERPLDSLAEGTGLALEPDDVPLLHEPHPFDAPAGESMAPIVKRSALDREPFSERELQIEAGIARCLSYYMQHPENTVRRGPWALMHATLPFGVEGEVIAGNRRVNTIGWLCFNGTSGKQHMFQPTRTGFRPNVGPGVQGHDGQFLAILAQAKVRGDFPLQINGRNYTVMDLARYEMSTCREKAELTFKLIGLSRYLEADAQWRDNRGRPWSLEKILVEEMAQPVNGAACGGVHRLMGLSYAIIERRAAGQPISGNWERAQTYLDSYIQYTLTLQNSDGSFSTNWFESRGMDPNVERRVQTSGHILEWLVYTLPDEHLRSPQIQQGIEFLLNSIGREPQKDWPIGPRGHALRAMALYSQRVFGAEPGQLKSYLANVPQLEVIR